MINEAEYIRDYQLKILFVDGIEKIIDLYSFISKSNHPLIRKYLDINLFKNFTLIAEQFVGEIMNLILTQ